jgi:small conductance mechanosensitive channel
MKEWLTAVVPMLTEYGIKVLGAIVIWFVGRWVIGKCDKLIGLALGHRQMDPTLVKYISSIVSTGLNIFLILAILSQFGVNTTSFAALIAAAGLAIGAAWSGMLSNFAAGVFLVLFKPFKIGDHIAAAGGEGNVT